MNDVCACVYVCGEDNDVQKPFIAYMQTYEVIVLSWVGPKSHSLKKHP